MVSAILLNFSLINIEKFGIDTKLVYSSIRICKPNILTSCLSHSRSVKVPHTVCACAAHPRFPETFFFTIPAPTDTKLSDFAQHF